MVDRRRLLPLVRSNRQEHGGRSPMTCQYKCGNACDHPVPNESDNGYIGDLIQTAVTRRTALRAGALGALVGGFSVELLANGTPASAHDVVETVAVPTAPTPVTAPSGALTFKAIPPNRLDALVVPNGYDHAVIIRWGDPVERGAPAFDLNWQTAAAQKRQFGYNNDFMALLPYLDGRTDKRALLVVNHEYTNEELMFPGYTGPDSLTVEQIKVTMAAQGLSIVELERVGRTGEWRLVRDGLRVFNRRLTALDTTYAFAGPAAGSALLKTAADPTGRKVIGSLNNCSGGVTPWGTVLSGEENFNQYFVGGDGAPADLKPKLARYGISTTERYPAGNRKWDRADARFDLTANPNEAHRFGWILEVDPYTPHSVPRKHTALGRTKHEAGATTLAKDGRAVVYLGDDERFDYLYKFVSDKKYDPSGSASARRHNLSLLESGTLYVAKFEGNSGAIAGTGALPSDGAFDGTGTWIPLAKGNQSLVPGMSIEEVLIFTRLAGDKVGATKMDRPEDVEANPETGKVYAVMTNNTNRGVGTNAVPDEVNPRNRNRHGHIVEITESGGDNGAETFTWDLFLVCGDPTDPAPPNTAPPLGG
jgi:uncharacterized protein